jgi:peptidoglycan/xylan/chitin deacetylase (PgdA/CDA1 family)
MSTTSPPAEKVQLPQAGKWFAVAEGLVGGVFVIGPAAFIYGLSRGTSGWILGGLGVMLLLHMVALWGMLRPGSNLAGAVQTRLPGNAPEVWLTLDDGPDPATTPTTLDQLREAGVKATFFVIGARAEAYPELIDRIVAEGHTLGNHTQTHPATTYWAADPVTCERELLLCQVALWRLTRQTIRLFRPPAGLKGLFLHMMTQRHNVRVVMWSARGLDGVDTDENAIFHRLAPDLTPGAIILLHEGRPTTPTLLPRVLAELNRRGLTCVPPRW